MDPMIMSGMGENVQDLHEQVVEHHSRDEQERNVLPR